MIRVAFCRWTLSFAFEARTSRGAMRSPKAFYVYLLLKLVLPQEYVLHAPKDAYLSK